MNASQRETAAQQMRIKIGHVTPAEFKMRQLQHMRTTGLVDPVQAKHFAARSALSDPEATARIRGRIWSSMSVRCCAT